MSDSNDEEQDSGQAGFSRWPWVYAAVVVFAALTIVAIHSFSQVFSG